jgi:hypothetical protein
MFHDFVARLKLVMLHYNIAMFQCMENTCCFYMLHNHNSQAIMYETSTMENAAYTCFKQQLHDEMNDAHVYEMKMQFVGAKHLGCYIGAEKEPMEMRNGMIYLGSSSPSKVRPYPLYTKISRGDVSMVYMR